MDAPQKDTAKDTLKRLRMRNYMRESKKSLQRKPGATKKLLEKVFNCYFLFGLLSLVWLMVRTDTKVREYSEKDLEGDYILDSTPSESSFLQLRKCLC